MEVDFSSTNDENNESLRPDVKLPQPGGQLNFTTPINPGLAPNFGLAILILGGGVLLVLLVCFCVDLFVVYVCCVVESPLKRYNEEQARRPSSKKKKKTRKKSEIGTAAL